jgi:IS30 family transposase
MSYQHLSLAERHYIEISRKKKVSHNQIAKDLGRSQSTITREIRRNTGLRGYRHKQANHLATGRHSTKSKYVKLTDEVKYLLRV